MVARTGPVLNATTERQGVAVLDLRGTLKRTTVARGGEADRRIGLARGRARVSTCASCGTLHTVASRGDEYRRGKTSGACGPERLEPRPDWTREATGSRRNDHDSLQCDPRGCHAVASPPRRLRR